MDHSQEQQQPRHRGGAYPKSSRRATISVECTGNGQRTRERFSKFLFLRQTFEQSKQQVATKKKKATTKKKTTAKKKAAAKTARKKTTAKKKATTRKKTATKKAAAKKSS